MGRISDTRDNLARLYLKVLLYPNAINMDSYITTLKLLYGDYLMIILRLACYPPDLTYNLLP
jgi:hypothetical protein